MRSMPISQLETTARSRSREQSEELLHRRDLNTVVGEHPDQREIPGQISVPADQVPGPSDKCSLKYQIIGSIAAYPELAGQRHTLRPSLNH